MRTIYVGVPLATTFVIGAALVAGAVTGNPFRFFEEKTLATYFSALLLLGIAWLCYRMRRNRHVAPDRSFWKPGTAIWGLMALGFSFLALDEVGQVHERMDKVFHRVFAIQETRLTDRLDDAIVGLYGIVGITALCVYRKELARHRQALPFVTAGFALFFVMVGLDTLTSSPDVLGKWFPGKLTKPAMTGFSIAEESCKLYAGTSFFLAFYSAVDRADGRSAALQTARVREHVLAPACALVGSKTNGTISRGRGHASLPKTSEV